MRSKNALLRNSFCVKPRYLVAARGIKIDYHILFMPSNGVDQMQKNKFDDFFINRNSLIEQYNKGDLNKKEFIENNYYYIQSMDVKPFQKVDNIKKGLFNYQYYNVIAKYCQKRAHDSPNGSPQKKDFIENSNYYYSKKDKMTMKILELLDFRGIEAYYVKVKSDSLKNKLFEIVLSDYDEYGEYFEHVILHSKNEEIKNRLLQEGVFRAEKKKSLIDSYINQKY